MHKVVAQKISVANKSTNGRRAHRSVVVLSKSDHRPEAFRVDAAATKTVWACVASLLLSIDSASPALAEAASTSAKGTQGAVLEDLLKQQQEGKVKAITLKAAGGSAPAPAYAQAKTASKSTAKPKAPLSSSVKPKQQSSSKKPAQAVTPQPKQGTRTGLKFDGKAAAGTQGSAPTGLELPVPKALAKSKVAATAQSLSTTKRPDQAKAKPAPVVSKKPLTSKPAAIKEKKTISAPAPVAIPVPVPAPAPVPTPVPSARPPAPKTSATVAPALGNDAIQAGGVLAAEILGLVVASTIVGQLTKPVKALKTIKA